MHAQVFSYFYLFFHYSSFIIQWFSKSILFEQAIVFYELAFNFNPHCAEACNNLGVIYKDRDNLDKAVECYQANSDTCADSKFSLLCVCRWNHICHCFYFAVSFINQTKLLTVIEQPWCCLHSPGLRWSHAWCTFFYVIICLSWLLTRSFLFCRVKWMLLQAWLRKLSWQIPHMLKHIIT
jgi:tetratricopeptide (TPR) repeat protein